MNFVGIRRWRGAWGVGILAAAATLLGLSATARAEGPAPFEHDELENSIPVGHPAELDRVLPLAFAHDFGVLSVATELAYHAQFQRDEWTLDSELAIPLGYSLSLLGVARMTATPSLQDLDSRLHGGISYDPSDWLSLVALAGEGVRDTDFEERERVFLLGVRAQM